MNPDAHPEEGKKTRRLSNPSRHKVDELSRLKDNPTSCGPSSTPQWPNWENVTYSQTVHDFHDVLCHLYEPWSSWRPCSRKCQQERVRTCRASVRCGRLKLRERKSCRRKSGLCVPLRAVSRSQDSASERVFNDDERLVRVYLYQVLYGPWSLWGTCTRSCKQSRRRRCVVNEVCKSSFIQEGRACGEPGTTCHRRLKKKKQDKPPRKSEGDDDDDVLMDFEAGDAGPEEDAADHDDKGYDLSVDTLDRDPGPHEDHPEEEGQGDGWGASDAGKPKKRRKHGRKEAGPLTDGSAAPASERSSPDKADAMEQGGLAKVTNGTEVTEDVLGAGLLDTCGVRPPTARGSFRVIGGQESQRLSWPWQVALLTRWSEQYCGGTLVAPQWMMTAAHCVRKKGRRRRFVIRVGEHNLEDIEGTEDDITPEVEYPHPDFDYVTITNDIALVRMREPLPPFAHPGYACIPGENFSPDPDALCHILGWGKRKNTHAFGADSLFEVQVPIVKHKRCQKVFQYPINNHTQICAGYKKGRRDACAGDSGGPLLCPKTDRHTGLTRWYLAGITSYGEGCGRKGKFGIYTRVASYRQWIADTVNEYENATKER